MDGHGQSALLHGAVPRKSTSLQLETLLCLRSRVARSTRLIDRSQALFYPLGSLLRLRLAVSNLASTAFRFLNLFFY